jgi:hypothetical protein
MPKLHDEIHPRHCQCGQKRGFGSALMLPIAAGAKANAEIRNAEADAGEDHQEHEPIDDGHISGTGI